jgi:hypothetical protein
MRSSQNTASGHSVITAYLSRVKLTRVLASFASVALLVAGLVALLPDCAYACSCGVFPGSPQELAKRELEESCAVFSGEVQDINKENGTVTLRTIEVWKGPHRDTLEVTNSNMCWYPFEEGREYLVYADYYADQGFSVSLCGNNKPLSEARKCRRLA